MKISLKYSWILLLSLILSVAGWLLVLCGNDRACSAFVFIRTYLVSVLGPVTIYSLCVVPFGVGILFARRSNIATLLRFVRWWIPLSLVLILLAPNNSDSFFTGFPMDKNMASWMLGLLFTIIGLYLALRKSKNA